jgi:DNA polymerase
MYISDAEARAIVDGWRAANQWCVGFWGRHDDEACIGLWGAALAALDTPRRITQAGRIRFIYMPEIDKSLLMILPSGRLLTYRDIRFERVADLDEDDNVIGYSTQLRFYKGYGRAKVWHGTLCENAVQAVAADILRGTLVRLEAENASAVAHTHDEVVLECNEDNAVMVTAALYEVMTRGFDWSEGLPIAAEQQVGYYYSKAGER